MPDKRSDFIDGLTRLMIVEMKYDDEEAKKLKESMEKYKEITIVKTKN